MSSPPYKPLLCWVSRFAVLWAILLLFAGSLTTSIDAGMAFLDWPLSNGSLNPEGWTENPDQLAEHSHRLMGMKLGLLSLGLMGLFLWQDKRRRVRALATLLPFLVLAQGLLGGLRVLLDRLNLGTESNLVAQSFAVAHAGGAQIVLLALVTLAVVSSRSWMQRPAPAASPALRRWAWASVVLIFVQIVIGAVMRHGNAGLAIATFPFSSAEGDLLPPHWNWAVAVNFAHRAGAVAVSVALLGLIAQIWKEGPARRAWGAVTALLLFLLAAQVILGAVTTWTYLNAHAATTHALFGAFLLAVSWALTLRTQPARERLMDGISRTDRGLPPSPASSPQKAAP